MGNFGNWSAVILCLIETFFINGLYHGWGIFTNIMRKEKLFLDYCDQNSCDGRDELFNKLYTLTTIAVSSSSLLSGALITKWGHFTCSVISLFFTTVGFLLLALISINQNFLFPGYLLISTAGFLGHLMNVQVPRTIPKLTVILMTTFAGLYSASSSSFLAIQYLHDHGYSINSIFCALAILTIVLKLPRILFLTPHHLPKNVSADFSLFRNRVLCNIIEDNEENQMETTSDASLKTILCEPMIYFICLGYSAFSLRSLTFAAWMGSSWPTWIGGEHFQIALNNFKEYANLLTLSLSFIPGLTITILDRKLSQEGNNFGKAIGLAVFYSLCSVLFVASGILGSFEGEIFGYSSVVTALLGRAFGSLWPTLLLLVYPPKYFSLAFGTMLISSVFVKAANLFLYKLVITTGSFTIPSITVGLLSLLIFVFTKISIEKARQIRNEQSRDFVQTDSESDTDSLLQD